MIALLLVLSLASAGHGHRPQRLRCEKGLALVVYASVYYELAPIRTRRGRAEILREIRQGVVLVKRNCRRGLL